MISELIIIREIKNIMIKVIIIIIIIIITVITISNNN